MDEPVCVPDRPTFVVQALILPRADVYIFCHRARIAHYFRGTLQPVEHDAYLDAVNAAQTNRLDGVQRAMAILAAVGFDVTFVR